MSDKRYLQSKQFFEYAYTALKHRFKSKKEFEAYFAAIEDDEQKNLFLKTASYYLFLVKGGSWCLDVHGIKNEIDYLTDTYKYIALFSLIESLDNNHQGDFFAYLNQGDSSTRFPISKEELTASYEEYKRLTGAIQKSIRFFESLSPQTKKKLAQKIQIGNAIPTIETISKYLYNLRSKFVHEMQLVVNMSGISTLTSKGSKSILSKLSLKDLMNCFEEGLLTRFNRHDKRLNAG